MQPKKIITLFLAVILTCFLAVSIFAVEDDPLTMAVEVSSSTAISTTAGSYIVKAGDEIKVKITVESTPENVAFYQFKISYDTKAFTPKTVNGAVDYKLGSAARDNVFYVGDKGGAIDCFTFGQDEFDMTHYLAEGDLITLTFVANANFDGNTIFKLEPVTFRTSNGTKVENIEIKHPSKLTMHAFGEPVVVDGDCVTKGSTTYTCTVCEYKLVVEGAEVSGHKFDAEKAEEKYLKSAATCTAKAVYYKSCSVCGEKDTNTFEYGEAAQHKFEDMITNNLKYQASPADCVNAAKFYYSCSVCGEMGTETFAFGDPKGHTEVVDAAVAATCTTAGKTEGKHCSVCNTVTVAQTEVKALGHKEVVDAAVAATCTTAGKTEGKHCSVCNTVTVAQTEVKALGHKFDKESATDAYKATDATCTDKATFYKSCSVCGVKGTETFASGDLAAHAAEDLVKLEAVAPTCTETGLTEGEMCSKCNATTKAQDTVAANGHVAGDWVVETEPKIGKEGKQYKACTVCSSIVEIETIPAKSALPIILIIVAVVVVGGGVGVFFVLKNKKED